MRKAFSLLELLIVLIIISILTAIVIPKFKLMKTISRNNLALYDLKNLESAELSYFATYFEFAAFNTTDIQPNGIIRKGNFYFKAMSKDVLAVAKTDPTQNYLNICTKHNLGDKIYCYESDKDAIFYKESPIGHELTEDDCPNATSNWDCAPPDWKIISQ
jgi:prepilin-type N-terminal cleavage/methylation domain-containing protein